jgi:hypothetical protein
MSTPQGFHEDFGDSPSIEERAAQYWEERGFWEEYAEYLRSLEPESDEP